VVVDAEVKENEQDHSQELMERCAKKRKQSLDRADLLRDVRLPRLNSPHAFTPQRERAFGKALTFLRQEIYCLVRRDTAGIVLDQRDSAFGGVRRHQHLAVLSKCGPRSGVNS
jgi:hypothetical protein